jgi:ABC-type nitrate/sulfonate/bicarbonate transport system ATPase subunit
VAIQDVSFVVHDLPNVGELIAVVGPSGCGKSTVLRLLAGLRPHFPPTAGTVAAFGQPVEKPGSDRGMVDQKYSLMPHLTVAENIAFGLKLRGVAGKERRDRAREWAKKVGLEGTEDKYPSELSGGMQQRVSIAATLILEPKILLMDEPFGALDPKIRMQMQQLLVELWKEQQSTVFIVTHSMDEAVYLGDRVLRMTAKPGRLVEVLQLPRPDEPPEVMRKRPWFNDLTQELLRRLETDAPAAGELPGLEKWRAK